MTLTWRRVRPGQYECVERPRLTIRRKPLPTNAHFGCWDMLDDGKYQGFTDTLRHAKFLTARQEIRRDREHQPAR